MSVTPSIKLDVQEEIVDNSAKLSMTECGLADVIESVENDSEEIVTIKVPVMLSVRNIDRDMKWKKILRKMLLLLMKTLFQLLQILSLF